MHGKGGNSGRHGEVEREHVDGVTLPGERLAIGCDDEPGKVVDRAAGRVLTGNPLGVEQGKRAGVDRDLERSANELARRICFIDVDAHGQRLRGCGKCAGEQGGANGKRGQQLQSGVWPPGSPVERIARRFRLRAGASSVHSDLLGFAHTMRRGFFITFEGLDGSGKSTQLRRLAAHLRGRGLPVREMRQPGGTAFGDRVRALVLAAKDAAPLSPRAELAMMFADRAQAIAEIVDPALERGEVLLCDRWTDSTEAYQGGGRALGPATVHALHTELCGGLEPELTLLLLPDLQVSLARARAPQRAPARTDRPRRKPIRSRDRCILPQNLRAIPGAGRARACACGGNRCQRGS